MTIIEKLKYDKKLLIKEFKKWNKLRPDRFYSERWGSSISRQLDNMVENYGYETFLNWAYSEFNEFEYLQLLPYGNIVLSKNNKDFHQVKVLDIFSSGWNWHIERLYPHHIKDNIDYSRAYYHMERYVMRQSLKDKWTRESQNDTLSRITQVLVRDRKYWDLNKCFIRPYINGRQVEVIVSGDECKKYWNTIEKVYNTYREKILKKDYKWDVKLLKEML